MSSWSIKSKFLAVIAPLIILTLASVTMITTVASNSENRARLHTKLEHVLANQTIVLARGLSSKDTRLTGLVLAGLMADPDIVFAAILDPDGNTVMALGEPPRHGEIAQREIRYVENLEIIVAGKLALGISHAGATDALWTDLRRSSAAALIALGVIWIATVYGFHHAIGYPLGKLQSQIRQWRGNGADDDTAPGGDEIASLTSAFTTLQRERLDYEEALEDMNLRLEARVQERTEALREALAAAKRADGAKAEFLAAMSHEIRTPMNAILGIAHALSVANNCSVQQRNFDILLESGRTLMVLLDDVLDISKIEAGHLEIVPISADLHQLMRDLCDLWRQQAREKGLALRLEIDESVPVRLNFDPVRLRQCVSNLLSNAVKFTNQGEIIVSVWAEADERGSHRIFLTVRDSGIGIPLDTADQLFEPFTQADSSMTRNFGGTGLGLAITQRLAGLMGGDVFVTSQLGEGTVFRLSFVAARPTLSAEGGLLPGGHGTIAQASSEIIGRRILVVDDVPTNRYVARLMLEQAGAEVEEVDGGRAALERLESSSVDLVILDLHMPDLDGFETTELIRALPSPIRHIPIVALTADVRPEISAKLERCGVDGILHKPIDFVAAVTEIRRVLPPRASNVIHLSGYESAS